MKKINKLIVYTDGSNNMIQFNLNNKVIKEGNLWDIHDGCMGDSDKYGQYNNIEEFIANLKTLYPNMEVVYESYVWEY